MHKVQFSLGERLGAVSSFHRSRVLAADSRLYFVDEQQAICRIVALDPSDWAIEGYYRVTFSDTYQPSRVEVNKPPSLEPIAARQNITATTWFRRAKAGLSVMVTAIAFYLIVGPFLPQAVNNAQAVINQPLLPGEPAANTTAPMRPSQPKPKLTGNRMIIPSINLEAPIVEGRTETTMDRGIWHRPGTGIPTESNMVLSGHRFEYLSNHYTLYHLDKVQLGDVVTVVWGSQEYRYEVTGTKVVEPTAVYIEAPTKQPQLTIYTCTPIPQADKRLVVIAKPI